MARKIIKGILFILAAVVVAGGIITYLRSQKNPVPVVTQPEKPVVPEMPKISQIESITVNPVGDTNAQVQIKGVKGRDYHIQNLETAPGFRIELPYTQIEQVQKLMDKPHPLIEKIEVHEVPEHPNAAEVIFYTQKNVNFLDSQQNDTLTIDFTKAPASDVDSETAGKATEAGTMEKSETAATKETPKTTPSATAKSTSSKSKPVAKKSSSTKNTTTASKSKPKTAPKVETNDFDSQVDALTEEEKSPAPQPSNNLEPAEFNSVNDPDFKNDFSNAPPEPKPLPKDTSAGRGQFSNTENINQPSLSAPAEPGKAAAKTDEDDGFSLKDVVTEDTKTAPESTNLLDAETQLSMKENLGNTGTQVAAVPQNQKFDLNQVQANLPALQNMNVEKSGTSTVVTFDREKNTIQYKFLKMVNPSRIVVEFLNAKNLLKPEYPRFSGTKISRVETRQYASADGTLIQVILYVDGAPNYVATKKGNQVVVEVK